MPPFENARQGNPPIDHVFEVVPTPSNWNDFLSTLWEIGDVEGILAGGHRFGYTISLLGRPVERYEFKLTTIIECW